jgi:hypothetical protein
MLLTATPNVHQQHCWGSRKVVQTHTAPSVISLSNLNDAAGTF